MTVNERGRRLYVTSEGTLQLVPVAQWLNLRPDGPTKGAVRMPAKQLPEHLLEWQRLLAGMSRQAEVTRSTRAPRATRAARYSAPPTTTGWKWSVDGDLVTLGATGVWQLGEVREIVASRGVWREVVGDLRRLAAGMRFQDLPEDIHDVSPAETVSFEQSLFGARRLV